MNLIEKIKEIIFKVKDYDRLESDYCTCLDYATNSQMSKPNYDINVVKSVILDAKAECMNHGYLHAKEELIDTFIEKAEEFLYKELNDGFIECGDMERLIEEFKTYIKGE